MRHAPLRATALLLFIACFSLFALTAGPFEGYEMENAAVAEGLVRTGEPHLIDGSPLADSLGHIGRGGERYGRANYVQPLLEAPVMAAGVLADAAGGTESGRLTAARLFNPLITAATAVLVLLLLTTLAVPLRRALAVAGAFAVASIAWPYSDIGMETVTMALLAAALLACVRAAQRPGVGRWLIAGGIVGLAAMAKPYAPICVLPMLVLLLPALRGARARRRIALLAALGGPALLAVAVQLAYNWIRHGSLLDFGNEERLSPTLAAPLNWIGLFISPGKGLLFYSPLVALGLLGVPALWRHDRRLALAVLGPVALLTAFISVSAHWSDEVWGPRYLVPIAFLPLLALPWWVTTPLRRRVALGVAALAVAVQLLAVTLPSGVYVQAAGKVSGTQLFDYRKGFDYTSQQVLDSDPSVPYGRDPMRWVPELSPLVVHGKLVASMVRERLGFRPLVLTYAPFEGKRVDTDLGAVADGLALRLPTVWWTEDGTSRLPGFALAAVLLASLVLMARELRAGGAAPRELPAVAATPAAAGAASP